MDRMILRRCLWLIGTVLLAALLLFTTLVTLKGFAQANFQSAIRGKVTDYSNGFPVEGARVEVPLLKLATKTDANGEFRWDGIPLEQAWLTITVIVRAEGFGEWKLAGVPLPADDVLILTPRLRDTPVDRSFPTPAEREAQERLSPEIEPGEIEPSAGLTLPQTIRVRITGEPHCDPDITYTVDTVNFYYYVQHVLPNEWIPSWQDESLRAGALAAKTYAWYWISRGGKWKPDADVFDSTCDQVYNPEVAFESTNQAVAYTWQWALSRQGALFQAHHMANCDPPNCLGQNKSHELADAGYTWDAILAYGYVPVELTYLRIPPAGFALQFSGQPGDYGENRVLIPVEAISETQRLGNGENPPVDVGSQDFTIEWWQKTGPPENESQLVLRTASLTTPTCGATTDWIFGEILLDRSRFGVTSTLELQPGSYGAALLDGSLAFGVTGQVFSGTEPLSGTESLTLCSTAPITDSRWHHIAVSRQRKDGALWLFVDGQLAAQGDGPDGDLSYPDNVSPTLPSDRYLGLGAWKLDGDHVTHPFFNGTIDELRFSNSLRYTQTFTPSLAPFAILSDTVALYQFDAGRSNIISDALGMSHGLRLYGGSHNGPEWLPSDLFITLYQSAFMPLIQRNKP